MIMIIIIIIMRYIFTMQVVGVFPKRTKLEVLPPYQQNRHTYKLHDNCNLQKWLKTASLQGHTNSLEMLDP